MKKTLSISLSAILILSIVVGSTQAALLNLTLDHYPRVHATGLVADYYGAGHAQNDLSTGASEGLLVINATASQYYDETATPVAFFLGTFSIRIAVNPSDGEGRSGTISVTGEAYSMVTYKYEPVPGMDDEDLFYSTILTGFGFGAEDKFECTFTQEGTGMVAPDGEPIGIIIDARDIYEFDHPTDPYFTSPNPETVPDSEFEWHTTGVSGLSETFYLPEPTTVLVLTLAAVFAACKRRL